MACTASKWYLACIWYLTDILWRFWAIIRHFSSCFVSRRCWPFLASVTQMVLLISRRSSGTQVLFQCCLFGLWESQKGICSRRKPWVKYWPDPGYHQKYSQIGARAAYTLRRSSRSLWGEDKILASLLAPTLNDWLCYENRPMHPDLSISRREWELLLAYLLQI